MQRLTSYWPYLLYLTAGIAAIVAFDGTGDSGDSVLHYLLSRYAPAHPLTFFNHWAKPFFVLLSCPWAQFGLVGMKLFNLTVTLLAVRATQLVAIELRFANHWLIPIFFLFAPLNFLVTFSGLTEPLFSLFLSVALLLTVRRRFEWAAVLVSFLPFVRSEGLLIVGVFLLFFAYQKNGRAALALTTGHLIYSVTGFLAGKDLLWTITEIPYASTQSPYGSGNLLSFPKEMVFVLGIPMLVLFVVGTVVISHRFMRNPSDRGWIFLVVGTFLALFLFHTIAWAFGVFNSMGLKRVMVAVMPSMTLIVLVGFNFISEHALWKNASLRLASKALIIASIVLFPFSENHAAIHWDRGLSLHADQLMEHQAKDLIMAASQAGQRYVYTSVYLSVVLGIDHLEPKTRIDLCRESLAYIRPNDIVIWNNWSPPDCVNVDLEELESNPRFRQLGEFHSQLKEMQLKMIVYRYE